MAVIVEDDYDSVDNESGTGPAYVVGPVLACVECRYVGRVRCGSTAWCDNYTLECGECGEVIVKY